MIINVKKTFSAVSAAIALCCGVFAGTAIAQSDDLWGEYNSSAPTEMSLPESETPAGWEPLEGPDSNNKPAKAAKSKPEKTPKAAKAPKPAKEAKPKAAPVGGEDRTLNLFVNTGFGIGQGGYLLREVNKATIGGRVVNDDKDYYLNMGQGLKFEAGAGYMATPNLEARFSVDFNLGLFAPKIEESTRSNANPNDIASTNEINYSYFSWGVRVMAVPQFEVLEMLDMYLGTGLSLNFTYGTRDSSYTTQTRNANTVYDMKFAPAIGLCGIAGFVLPLSETMDFLGELQFESKSFTITKQVLRDGYTPADASPTSVITYKTNDNGNGINNAPLKYPGSNWGIRAGLRFWFAL